MKQYAQAFYAGVEKGTIFSHGTRETAGPATIKLADATAEFLKEHPNAVYKLLVADTLFGVASIVLPILGIKHLLKKGC